MFTKKEWSEMLDNLEKLDDEQVDLKKYFDMIQNKSDWKAPIEALIESENLEKCQEACMFYTGTELKHIGSMGGKYLVKSIGYRAGPCGDH